MKSFKEEQKVHVNDVSSKMTVKQFGRSNKKLDFGTSLEKYKGCDNHHHNSSGNGPLPCSAPDENSDEQYLNEWIKKQSSPSNKVDLEQISFTNGTCLEDHRLLIDRAIDKLKGELLQKEKDVI